MQWASEESKLYGSVTSSDIAAALAEQDIVLDRHDLLLPEPIKELGVFDVAVKLHGHVFLHVSFAQCAGNFDDWFRGRKFHVPPEQNDAFGAAVVQLPLTP